MSMMNTYDYVQELIPEAPSWAQEHLAQEIDRLRAEVEALRAALQRLADRRDDLCPTQIVHIVNTALRGEEDE